MKEENEKKYEAPEVEVLEVVVEKGFEGSVTVDPPSTGEGGDF